MLAGIAPVRLLCATFNCSKLFICPILSGNVPTNILLLTSNTVTSFNNPISVGKQPFNPTFNRIIWFRVPAIFPILGGKHPLIWLFARTTTDTGELPKFFGNDDLNLLLFTNSASSLKSKRLEGISPSNMLNRISRNLSDGSLSTTYGNTPDKRLLLTSSSNNNRSFLKLCGIVPQKKLEFMWKRVRSVRRPRSSGNVPEIPAWLRSIPATVMTEGSSGAGEQ